MGLRKSCVGLQSYEVLLWLFIIQILMDKIPYSIIILVLFYSGILLGEWCPFDKHEHCSMRPPLDIRGFQIKRFSDKFQQKYKRFNL